jgi:stage II sporulation protein D
MRLSNKKTANAIRMTMPYNHTGGNAVQRIARYSTAFLALFLIACLLLKCMPYTRRITKHNLVRIAVVCGVDNVTISAIHKGKLYSDYRVNSNHTFPLFFSPHNGTVTVNGVRYHGSIEMRKTGGRIWVINVLNMEDYLKGVVPCEIGGLSKNLIEAAKAQAVAARTYAYAHINQYDHLGFDLYATIQDQVYKGINAEREVTNRAIQETAGEIMTYRNQPIEAKYHSTCGGRTADFNDAWQGKAPPYLRSIRCTYCEKSPHYTWNNELPKAQFYQNLRNRLMIVGYTISASERITRIRLKTNKRSKRVREMIVETKNHDYAIPGYHIRKVFAYSGNPTGTLKSNYITIKSRSTTVIIEGRGYGHGVGMCQFGAIEQARQGRSYKDILRYYYRGARLRRMR